MQIQSLSVCVPGGCPNKCKFCVSRMHTSPYVDQIETNLRFYDLYAGDFCKRLQFARDNGCNTLILTGEGEPLINTRFLKDFSQWNNSIQSPFRWIEIQTSGVTLNDEKLRFLRNTVGVSTISLSLSDMFNNLSNHTMNGITDKYLFDIDLLCEDIKKYDFNLRLSLNMTIKYKDKSLEEIMERAYDLGANMVTFRKLYVSGDLNLEQNKWIQQNKLSDAKLGQFKVKIETKGRILETLPFGAIRYSYKGISTVIDDDCMATEVKPVIKYLVLRPNCKLYTKWDDEGSLLF